MTTSHAATAGPAHVSAGTPLGVAAQKHMNAGDHVPNDVTTMRGILATVNGHGRADHVTDRVRTAIAQVGLRSASESP